MFSGRNRSIKHVIFATVEAPTTKKFNHGDIFCSTVIRFRHKGGKALEVRYSPWCYPRKVHAFQKAAAFTLECLDPLLSPPTNLGRYPML